jgi:hypothetical protein
MPGIDDKRTGNEVTYLADAQATLTFAQANNLNLLTIWAIQRDNGGCPGKAGDNLCSGITQNNWDFSTTLSAYTN